MAKALDYVTVFKVLLDGGYICSEMKKFNGECKIMVINYQRETVGHITEKQLIELDSKGVIELNINNIKTSSNGSYIYYFHHLKMIKRRVRQYDTTGI